MTDITQFKYTRKDFASDQMVRWCPGCGDYAILSQLQKTLAEQGLPKENVAVISGIGCSSRFPYYMNTYGIHSIHGRAPTLASGLKIANPDLQVWVITGDGDGLSIGGNHFIHAIRRNMDINIILFNNRIYGLTKGQYSPTSKRGAITKTSPMGVIEHAFNPISVALGVEATFVARTVDSHVKHMGEMFRRAAEHKGTSFVEVYQNCVIFNDGAWSYAKDAKEWKEHLVEAENGKPLVFGKNMDKGIVRRGFDFEVVSLDKTPESELVVHDESDLQLAFAMSRMHYPALPEPIGVIHAVETHSYEEDLIDQVARAQAKNGPGDLKALYNAGETWEVA